MIAHTPDEVLEQLDTYLCDIKEAQIRHGLHILGELPNTDKLTDTIIALLRLPRGTQINDAGLLHNMAEDLKLEVERSRDKQQPLIPVMPPYNHGKGLNRLFYKRLLQIVGVAKLIPVSA